MRVARFSSAGNGPRYGLVELEGDGGEHPQTVAVLDADPLAGPVNLTGERLYLDDVRLLAPVIPRSKVLAVGRNYVEHAAELGNEVPPEPLVFMKPNTSVIGPGEAIVRPTLSKDVHYEGELAVVISRICRKVPIERVPDVVFGYTCANDVTARDLQAIDDQWTRAKGFDTFCPLGPWIITHMDLATANDLEITTTVDGEVRQQGTTADMVYDVAKLVSFISEFTTLLPGDVILTGTPVGVGELTAGHEVSVSIEGIGTLTNTVIDDED